MTRRLTPLFPFVAAAVITGFAIASLPSTPFQARGTPYDVSIPSAAATFRFLSSAAAVIPRGASFVAATYPRDPAADTHLFRAAVALLPGRDLVPLSSAEAGKSVDFLVVAGARPPLPDWDLVLETPQGTVWRRRP